MGLPSSAASASAVVAAVGALPDARVRRSRARGFPDDIIALAVRWYVRYRLSYAEVSEWLAERGVLVDQSTIYRWVQRFLPSFGEVAGKYRDPVRPDWRVDEIYARIRGRWHYIYRAIDGHGQIVDACVSSTRDMVAARRFFKHAIASSGTTPRRIISDKAAAYPPALAAAVPGVLHLTGRYRTNGIERDHGFLKERLRPMRIEVDTFHQRVRRRPCFGAKHLSRVLPHRRSSQATDARVELDLSGGSRLIRPTTGRRREPRAPNDGRNPTQLQENRPKARTLMRASGPGEGGPLRPVIRPRYGEPVRRS